MRNILIPASIKIGDLGRSRFARNGVFSQCVRFFDLSLCNHQNLASLPSGQTAPPDQNMPRIISKLLTLGYQSKICKQVNISVISVSTIASNLFSACPQAFPPGKHFSVPSLPNIASVNVLGGFEIAADRLAIIDGEGS
jgi:hypothetical protein